MSEQRPRIAVVTFPGSNDDGDARIALEHLGAEAASVWHATTELDSDIGAVVLPGGFSYGDYLRCGALARSAPVMDAVRAFAADGGPVLGICNGFQILCEAGLLPGAMLRNKELKYRCEFVTVRVEQTDTPFTGGARAGQVLRIPIGHGEGNYYAPPDVLEKLEANRQVVFRYSAPDGTISDESNPNGSLHAIAGICNERRNVVGMMPHPERACESALGGTDGLVVLESIVKAFAPA